MALTSQVFAPHLQEEDAIAASLNDNLNTDSALDAYCEYVIWSLSGVHAMIRYGYDSLTY